MTEIIHREAQQSLSEQSTISLKKRLAEIITVTAQSLVEMSHIWNELERRGEDLSALRTGMTRYLPAIARGDLDAEVVVRFAGYAAVIGAVSQMSLEDQRRFLNTEEFRLTSYNESGNIEIDVLPMSKVSSKNIGLITRQGKLLSDQDRANLARQSAETSRKKPKMRLQSPKVEMSKKNKRGVNPFFEDSEWEALKKAARDNGLRVNELFREAVFRAGFLKDD